MKFILFFIVLYSTLLAQELKKVYFTPTNEIKLSLITHDYSNDKTIYTIQRNRYLLRIPTKRLLQLLQKNGYYRFKASFGYTTFIKTSQCDLSALEVRLQNYLLAIYPHILIKKITIIPKKQLKQLPSTYHVKFPKTLPLRSNGTFSIITPQKHQIFFQYFVDATINVYFTKKPIQKAEQLSLANIEQRKIPFDRFFALPLQNFANKQAKYHLQSNHLLTQRDVTTVTLVKRGAEVNVIFQKGALEIDMSAKALQGGSLNDIIVIQTLKGKKLKAKVIGKNLVKVETFL